MGLTVRAAAELLGVAPSTVQDWRTGVSRRTGRPIELPHMLGLACAALAQRKEFAVYPEFYRGWMYLHGGA